DNVVCQIKELVVQNYNQPSIFYWGLSNEISISGETEDIIQRHKELNEIVKSMDPTRLTTIANVSMLDVKSELCQITDILSYNHYFGWYGGEYTDNEAWFDDYHKNYPDRAIGFSEYGCEAILTWHTSNPQQGDYSEEYQNLYHEHMAKIIWERPYLWATHVWNMFDFAADARDEGGCQGRNNKGLVTYDRKTKKDTYYLYQTYLQGAPVLHITSKRYLKRAEDVTEVKVYSTEPEVSLYVNGVLLETKACDKVVTFQVKLEKKKTKIKAVAGNMVDNSVIIKVKQPYAGYSHESKGEGVANWFGENGEQLSLTYNRDYLCIKDQIKEIMANPEGAALMDKFMKDMMASMGGEMAGFKVSPAMMKMVQSFTIERISSMLKDKIPGEIIYKINEELQKIKK
ncbi:MAG: hypothetical protein J6R47_06270, partial [Acholeplasmatales bacterium]|nr:hypothetical protein [Acholeplasmatales bacterium]